MIPRKAPRRLPGALRRFARILLKPRDLMIVAPQVLSPLTDCRPVRQTIRYGHVDQERRTSVLVKYVNKLSEVAYGRNVHVLPGNLKSQASYLVFLGNSGLSSDEDVGLVLSQPSWYAD
jgi:hypothetical protein